MWLCGASDARRTPLFILKILLRNFGIVSIEILKENGAKNVIRVIEPELMLYKSRMICFNDYYGEKEQETSNRLLRKGVRAFFKDIEGPSQK